MEAKRKSAHQLAREIGSGQNTACRLTEEGLKRCKNLNASLNTFTFIAENEALEQANRVDKTIAAGEELPLAGVPLAVKDDFCCSGLPASLGSAAFKNFVPSYSAAAVEALLEAGCVLIGKTNLDDMGMGSSTLSSPFGPSLNPWSTDHAAGSAGAAAVSSGQCLLSLESDTGGALRLGASHCGIFGLRPTPGRISRYGLSAFSSSFSQVGIAAANPEDIGAVLEVLSGFDERDVSTALCRELPPEKEKNIDPGAITIGVWNGDGDRLSSANRDLIRQTGEKLQQDGFKISEISLELFPEALRAYYIVVFAEASSNLSRYDGIRFGEAYAARNLDELYEQSRRRTFGEEARRRSIYGTVLLGKERFEPFYRQALKIRRLFKEELARVFKHCDLLLMPVVNNHAPLIGREAVFIDQYEEDYYSAPVSLAGLPALSLPAGTVGNMPVGLQLIGPPLADDLILKVAAGIAEGAAIPPIAERTGRDA
ncbi:MAG: hypothetical protein AVO34_02495 [Firmicutes bacterium ML8_F2]|nr:MAG: hypothetical protein AVO34_02495 [Firmicutes bacterium ML8_F2]